MSTLPEGVKVTKIIPTVSCIETEIAIPKGVADSIRTNDQCTMIFISLTGRRPEGCEVDDWRAVAMAAIARMREVETHLEDLLRVSP